MQLEAVVEVELDECAPGGVGGHLGGLVGGILATFALAHFRYARPRSLGPAIVGLIMVASLVLAYARVESYVLPVG